MLLTDGTFSLENGIIWMIEWNNMISIDGKIYMERY